MTRYGGMGRTRPKKLTSKASIPIIRETDIDVIEDEIQSSLQQIETGVEKAEESVSLAHHVTSDPCPVKNLSRARRSRNPCLLTRLFRRNTISKRPLMLRLRGKSMMPTSRPQTPYSVISDMTSCTHRPSRSRRLMFASPPLWRTVVDARIT